MKFHFAGILLISLCMSLAFGQDQAQPVRSPSAGQSADGVPPIPTKPGKMVTFEVLIADLLEPLDSPTVPKILELEKAGKLNFLTRLQLTSLEEQTASVQFGETTPRTTSRAPAGRGFVGGPFAGRAPPNSPSLNVGTLVRVTARIDDDGSIVTQLMAERSGLNAGSDQAIEPNDGSLPKVDRLMTQTTLRLKPGEPQLVGGQRATTGKDTNRTWIVLIARVGDKPLTAK